MSEALTADEVIAHLGLEPHPEGGWYRQTFKDAVGRYVVKDMIQKLQTADEAWVQYLWPKPGATVPSRKLAYIRKVKVGDETLIVGSDFFLASF